MPSTTAATGLPVICKMPSRTAAIRLVSSHPQVYEPCDDSFALVDALLADQTNLINQDPKICMEIGCGSGYVITSLILLLRSQLPDVHYLATDTNPIATKVTNKTLEAHGVNADVICTDIASALEKRLKGSVDVIVVNPPYVPSPKYEVRMEGITSSWAGGENGRAVIDRILPIVDVLLSEKGWFYLVTLSCNYPLEICLMMRKKGYASRVVVQRSTNEENILVLKFWRDKVEETTSSSFAKFLVSKELWSDKDEESLDDQETTSSSFPKFLASNVSQFSKSLSSFVMKQWP